MRSVLAAMAAKIKVREIESHGESRWEVDIPATLNGGKRTRPTFETEAAAWLKVAAHERLIREHGQQGIAKDGDFTFSDALKRFRGTKEMSGRHEETARSIHDQFSAVFGTVPVKSISPLDLQGFWMRPDWQPTTRSKAFRYLRLIFNWMERYDIIDRNPARRVEPPKEGDPKKNILTPKQMAGYLKNEDPIFRAFLCLGGFEGLRTSEIEILEPDHVEEEEICVNAGTKDERWVAITPAFKRFWLGLPKLPETTEKFYAHIRAVTGGKWPSNCLRHSFGSYHLALHEDAGKTAFQMGNSEAVVRKSYARAVRKAQALAWWNFGLESA